MRRLTVFCRLRSWIASYVTIYVRKGVTYNIRVDSFSMKIINKVHNKGHEYCLRHFAGAYQKPTVDAI